MGLLFVVLVFFIVFVVLKDIFIFVFLKSFVIVLMSVPKYVKVAHFSFCVSLVLRFCFGSCGLFVGCSGLFLVLFLWSVIRCLYFLVLLDMCSCG
jgi:hypothetical protein